MIPNNSYFHLKKLIILSIVLAFVMLQACNFRNTSTPFIALPDTGGYVEAWTPHLTTIAQKLGIPEVAIHTYKNYEELESLFRKADKNGLLWAEVLLSSSFPVENLYSKRLISAIDNSKNFSFNFPKAINSAIQFHISNPVDTLYGLPLSLNPWVQIYNPQAIHTDSTIELAVPGVFSQYLLASYTYIGTFNQNESQFLSDEELLNDIAEMSNNGKIQQNASTYTSEDALQFFLRNSAKNLLISCEDLHNLPVEKRTSLSIRPMGKHISSDISYALFPLTKEVDKRQLITAAQALLVDPVIVFSTSNTRNWIPASIGTLTKNSQTDFIRKQIRDAETCTVPENQGYFEKNKHDVFLGKVKAAFSSNMK